MIAASVKACIVNVLYIPFQNTPYPGTLDLYFTFLVILPDADAISTSAAFLLMINVKKSLDQIPIVLSIIWKQQGFVLKLLKDC